MRRRSLVVRVLVDEAGTLHGQITDPLSEERHTFRSSEELWEAVKLLISAVPERLPEKPQEPL